MGLGEKRADFSAGCLLHHRDKPLLHRTLEGAPDLAHRLLLARLEQGAFEGRVQLLEERDDVVVADDRANARRPAAVELAVKLAHRIRDLRARAAMQGRWVGHRSLPFFGFGPRGMRGATSTLAGGHMTRARRGRGGLRSIAAVPARTRSPCFPVDLPCESRNVDCTPQPCPRPSFEWLLCSKAGHKGLVGPPSTSPPYMAYSAIMTTFLGGVALTGSWPTACGASPSSRPPSTWRCSRSPPSRPPASLPVTR